MPRKLAPVDGRGLERSGIRFGLGAPGLDRAEVALARTAFAPHRHDRYALGITTGGVQTFRYRGTGRVCLPGQLHLLHPDEVHDGAPGGAGFAYRIVYLAPELVREALGALPFVAEPVQPASGAARPLALALAALLADLDEPVGELATAAVVDGLGQLAGKSRKPAPVDVRTVRLVRDHLAAHAGEPMSADALERLTGADRYSIVRHFRAAYGTTPDRYRMLRRLDRARAAIAAGQSLAGVAADAGFADQSHLTRQFKAAFGMTPGRWQRLTGQCRLLRAR